MRFLPSRWSLRPTVFVVVAVITCAWFLSSRSHDVDGAAPLARHHASLLIADNHTSARGEIAVTLPATSTLQLRLKLAGAQPVHFGGLQCGALADSKRTRDKSLDMTLYASVDL